MEVTAETEERGAESPRTPRGPLGAAPGTASGDAALNGQETDPGLVDAGQQAETPAASGTALPPLQPPLSAESSQMEAESSQMESLDVSLVCLCSNARMHCVPALAPLSSSSPCTSLPAAAYQHQLLPSSPSASPAGAPVSPQRLQHRRLLQDPAHAEAHGSDAQAVWPTVNRGGITA